MKRMDNFQKNYSEDDSFASIISEVRYAVIVIFHELTKEQLQMEKLLQMHINLNQMFIVH